MAERFAYPPLGALRFATAMTRGGPVKRTHTVSVRLTPDERAAWDRVRSAAARRELGAWVRDVVNDVVAGHGPAGAGAGAASTSWRVPGGPRALPAADRDARRQLAGVANNLNQIARQLNAVGAGGVLVDEVAAALVEVAAAARAVRER